METEQQQVEALQRWWKENGRSVIVALVVGFGGLAGYTYWQHRTQQQAEQLSIDYNELINATSEGKLDEALNLTDTVISEHPDSAYADLSALHAAAMAHAKGDLPAARRLLIWASEQARQSFVRSLARLRLARMMLDDKKYQDALDMLARVEVPALAAMSRELRGDILLAQDKPGEAREQYATVLAGNLETADRPRLQEKLDAATSLAGVR